MAAHVLNFVLKMKSCGSKVQSIGIHVCKSVFVCQNCPKLLFIVFIQNNHLFHSMNEIWNTLNSSQEFSCSFLFILGGEIARGSSGTRLGHVFVGTAMTERNSAAPDSFCDYAKFLQ